MSEKPAKKAAAKKSAKKSAAKKPAKKAVAPPVQVDDERDHDETLPGQPGYDQTYADRRDQEDAEIDPDSGKSVEEIVNEVLAPDLGYEVTPLGETVNVYCVVRVTDVVDAVDAVDAVIEEVNDSGIRSLYWYVEDTDNGRILTVKNGLIVEDTSIVE